MSPTSQTIPRLPLDGMEGAISSLIVGCDNQPDLDLASALWDAWWEAGGNGFDTAHIYGQGLHEQNLGAWMRSRGVAGRRG